MLGKYCSYLIVRWLICILQCLRVETCAELASALARLVQWSGLRRRLVDDNLRLAFPKLDGAARRALAREMWQHLFLLICEIAHAPRKIHETNWRDYVRLRDKETVTRCLFDRRPLMIVSAHFGNFEIGGYVLGILGFPTWSVARTLDNPFLDRFLNRFRRKTGQSLIPKKGGYEQLQQVLGDGRTVCFLADQYAGTKGCWVEFFGRPASAHKAIALLALEHDALLMVGYARRLGRPLHYEFGFTAVQAMGELPPAQRGVQQLTQWYTSQLETLVRLAPGQYWWLHDRWKDRRAYYKQKRAAARQAA